MEEEGGCCITQPFDSIFPRWSRQTSVRSTRGYIPRHSWPMGVKGSFVRIACYQTTVMRSVSYIPVGQYWWRGSENMQEPQVGRGGGFQGARTARGRQKVLALRGMKAGASNLSADSATCAPSVLVETTRGLHVESGQGSQPQKKGKEGRGRKRIQLDCGPISQTAYSNLLDVVCLRVVIVVHWLVCLEGGKTNICSPQVGIRW